MPYRSWVLLVVLLALAASAIAPYDRRDWCLEHLPTLAAIAFLVFYEKRPGGVPLDNASYTLLFLFTALHVIGAHHLYMRVPYDAWCEATLGVRPSDLFGASRNHYDRFVHFCFGLLVMPVFAELVHRHVTRARRWTIVVAIAFVGLVGKVYELAEWLIAIVMSPEAAEAYNGQQGDPFDAQKDMGLALLGSLAASPFVHVVLPRERPTAPQA
jgi:putative membrane protein